MTKPRDLPEDTLWVDFHEAYRLGLQYKRGYLARPILRFRLVAECGFTESQSDEFIGLVDKYSLAEIEWELRDDGQKPVQVVIE